MTKLDILQYIANIHNQLADVMVSGDNAIKMGNSLNAMRNLVIVLQKDIEAGKAEKKKENNQ